MNLPVQSAPDEVGLASLIACQRPGYGLDAEFYRSSSIYERDLERIFMRAWLYAGHTSQIPRPGDYFLFEIARESVIVVRGGDGAINALVNVCRHRGSRVCLEPTGTASTFVCRYHGWTYGLEGELRSKRYMSEDFDRSAHGLKRIRLEVLQGLIFVNFDLEAPEFGAATSRLNECLAPYRLDRTHIAARRHYPVAANWKLAIENFMECYHCGPAHPDYARIHSLRAPLEESADLQAAMLVRARRVGLTGESISETGLDAPVPGLDIFYHRHALFPGYLTGSENGQPLAPLLGQLTDFDGGATDVGVGPASFLLIYSDHALVYRFVPIGPERSDMDITWLVRSDAVAGADYDPERLTWLWHVTSEADTRIINNNQAGVNSRFYEPGPYSEMERHAKRFDEWYLRTLSGDV